MKFKLAALTFSLCSILCAQQTIWMVGDSTMASYPEKYAPLTGWGQALNQYCKPGIKVENRALSGYSSKYFIDQGRFAAFADKIKKGDYLIIQFGHNDQKKEKPDFYADSEKAYPEYLMMFIRKAKEKGATPILATSICRRFFKNGKITHSLAGYPDAVRKLAKQEKIDMVDLNKITTDRLNELGENESIKLFNHLKPGESPNWPKGNTDNTHLNRHGASVIAGWFVEDAKKQKLSLAELFR